MRYEKYLPKITEEDMRLIAEPIDIYGQNIYNGRCVRMGEDGKPQEVCRYEGFPKTAHWMEKCMIQTELIFLQDICEN